MVTAHAPIAGGIVCALGIAASTAVAIIKIRTERPPERVHAETQAVLAKRIDDPKTATVLNIIGRLAANNQADVTSLLENLFKLLQQVSASPDGSHKATGPSAAPSNCPGTKRESSQQISDEQLRKMISEQPDRDGKDLTFDPPAVPPTTADTTGVSGGVLKLELLKEVSRTRPGAIRGL